MENLVSIITPMYNSERYVEFTIKSVQDQTYNNWEMIIIDDCSKDSSVKIVEKFISEDNRIKIIKLTKNSGVANARNEGIINAKGDFIAFLDSDDLWHPNKLKVQINFMKKYNYIFTYTAHGYIDENNNIIRGSFKVPKTINYRTLLKGNAIHCLTVIIDRRVVNSLTMPNIKHEDFATWLYLLKNYNIANGINENLAIYRKSLNSLTSNKIKSAIWTWNIYRNYEKLSLLKSLYYFINYIIKSIVNISK